MAESDNILTKLHDLLLYVVPQLSKFPRDQKFVLGDRIETKLLEVQEQCLRAYYSREKRAHLMEANLTLETTRHLIRLAHGLRHFSNHTYAVLAEKLDEVGRMIGGWIRSLEGSSRSAGLQPASGERPAPPTGPTAGPGSRLQAGAPARSLAR
jgi:hypothetical protein